MRGKQARAYVLRFPHSELSEPGKPDVSSGTVLHQTAGNFHARGEARRKKTIEPAEVGSFIASSLQPGGSLCIGGLFKQGRPVALVREVIRSGIDRLKLFSSPGSGFDVDLMIAAGLVSETFLPAVTLENRLCPNFRMAVEAGKLKAHAIDALTIVGGLMAASHGVPFQPITAWHGSDVVKLNPLAIAMTSPIDGAPLYAVPALHPDLVLLHAQEADEYGNVRHLSTMTYADALMARAGKKVLVSVDRLVRAEVVTAHPRETTIASIYVDAVVELPFGAHPTASFPLYAMDEVFIDAFADLGDELRRKEVTQEALSNYLDRFVRTPVDVFDYLDAVGGYRHLATLEREARFI
jgi:glutaconate CoA-transferase, subunit A